MSKKKLIVVDISSFIFRAFFAIRHLSAPDGTPVNAVQGVWNMLFKLLTVYSPTHVLLARDTAGDTFRNELYSEYKANRGAPPDELVPQFPIIVELIEKMGMPNLAFKDYEADDIIGSICHQWKSDFDEILIASGDKDLMQLIDNKVKMVDTMKDIIYGPSEVFEKMGVNPNQIIDYLSIVGDTSDNVPGMKGIGAKGAAKLLGEYETLENCINSKDQLKGKRVIDAFENHVEDALLSKKLITILKDIDLGLKPEETKFQFSASEELKELFARLNFKSALKKLNDIEFNDYTAENNGASNGEFKIGDKIISPKSFASEIVSEESFVRIVKILEESQTLSCHTEYDSDDIINRELISITCSIDSEKAFTFPFNLSSFNNLDESKLIELLKVVWASPKKKVFTEHAKRDFSYAFKKDFEINAKLFDVVQLHYILAPDSSHEFKNLVTRYADHNLRVLNKKEGHFKDLPLEEGSDYLCERSCSLLTVGNAILSEVKMLKLEEVYREIDYPLIPILAKVENNGVRLNKEYLKSLENDFSKRLSSIEEKIKSVIDTDINLKSPKQVSELLFEKLNLPIIKKTKTGYSTDSEVLEELDSRNLSEVPSLILQYREIDKLLSTYVKSLPNLLNSSTGRLHTNFSLHTAATGRLSSTNPNLQNIPIRSESGKLIRKSFVATPGKLLLAADYSQVELRLLAHFSKDPTMVSAFKNNKDIHAQTASEVLGLSLEEVSSNDRSKAKAVNFGLMYGQSSFGLAKTLKIGRNEAKDYITNYFSKFSSVKSYLDGLKEEAETLGYAKTMHGRKRFLPDIKSTNRNIKAQAERVAINSPIQGTAADLIKLAMIKIDKELEKRKLSSKMILQVHDELIFEVPEDELNEMIDLIKEGMENVAKLEVPLTVDVGYGVNWFDIK